MWKKRDGKISCAGIKFRFEEENIKNDLIEKISCNANIPLDALLKSKETKPVKTEEQSSELQRSGLLKQYLKDGKCEVTFRLPKEAAPDAGSVVIVGDFNAWDASAAPMTKLENGDFTASLKLNGKKEYRFKYLIDGHHWENDWSADKYVPNSFGSDDSVVVL
ncbi:MAG: isoamylase early set domain-containing protein [Nitrospirae bacterium]|nr:isoamylase early set domain-containing protein [Nitrospirota bacterium]